MFSLSRWVFTSIRLLACSVSTSTLLLLWLPTTTTSGFFQDLTSIRPWWFAMVMTGRSPTAKCFSMRWAEAAGAATNIRAAAAVITGTRQVRWVIMCLIPRGVAVHHHGQQIRLLLISPVKVLARRFVPGILAQVLFTQGDELVN